MNVYKLASFALVLAAPLAMAQTSTWKSDPAHSEVDFTIKHLAVSNVHGRFGHVDATLVYDEKDITKSTVNATIDVTGVSTGETGRDNHLKTDSFFDVAKFATATFVSTSVAKGGSGLLVSGNLTIKGITKPVVLDVEGPSTPVTGMDKKLHTGFTATTTIHRSDFGIGSSFPSAVLGEDVKIEVDLDAAKQ
jgi:polyisoprenoid-binding protein YceI